MQIKLENIVKNADNNKDFGDKQFQCWYYWGNVAGNYGGQGYQQRGEYRSGGDNYQQGYSNGNNYNNGGDRGTGGGFQKRGGDGGNRAGSRGGSRGGESYTSYV